MLFGSTLFIRSSLILAFVYSFPATALSDPDLISFVIYRSSVVIIAMFYGFALLY